MLKGTKCSKVKNSIIVLLTCIILLNYLGMFGYVAGNTNHECIKMSKEMCKDIVCPMHEPHAVNSHKDLQCNICDKLMLYTLILKSYIVIALFIILTISLKSRVRAKKVISSQAKTLITLVTLKVRLDVGKKACICN